MSDSNKPDYDVMISKPYEKDGKKLNHYTQIGAGWMVAKSGISITLDATPTDGRFVLFPRTEKTAAVETPAEAAVT